MEQRTLVAAAAVASSVAVAYFVYAWRAAQMDRAPTRVARVFNKGLDVARDNERGLRKDLDDISKDIADLLKQAPSASHTAGDVSSPIQQDTEGGASGLTGKGALGYYHFSSDGKKLKTKWDNFDVDAELARLDEDRASGAPGPTQDSGKTKTELLRAADALLRDLGAVERGCEVTLSDLDAIAVPEGRDATSWAAVFGKLAQGPLGGSSSVPRRGGHGDVEAQGDDPRAARKGVVTTIQALLQQVDAARGVIAKWKSAL